MLKRSKLVLGEPKKLLTVEAVLRWEGLTQEAVRIFSP